MKNFINKNLAVILSFAIVLCTVLPIFSGFVKAETPTYTSDDIAALKAAWQSLSDITVAVSSKEISGAANVNIHNSADYQGGDLTDTSVLGEKYVTHTVTTASASDWIDRVIFNFEDAGYSFKMGQLKDFNVYYKTSVVNNVRPNFNHSGSVDPALHSPAYFAAATMTANSWCNLKMSDLPELSVLKNTLNGVKDETLLKIWLDIGGVSDVVIGSMFATFSAYSDSILALSETDEEAFINAALSFYAEATESEYYGNEDVNFKSFVTALSTVAGDVERPFKIAELKSAWQGLSDITVAVSSKEISGAANVNIHNSADYQGGDLTDTSVLGEKYVTHTVTTASASDWIDRVIFNFEDAGYSFKMGQLKDFNVYYKTSVVNNVRPNFNHSGSVDPALHSPAYFAAATMTANSWCNLKMSDLPELSVLKNTLNGVKDETLLKIWLDIGGASDVVIGSMFATFSAYSDSVLALSETDEEAFIKTASNFYAEAVQNGYYAQDDAAFLRYKDAVIAIDSDFEFNLLINDVKSKWLALPDAKVSFVPDAVDGESPINVYNTSDYQGGDLADKTVLGNKYATYHSSGESASDGLDYIKFNPAFQSANFTVSQLKNYSVYLSTTSALIIRPRVIIKGNERFSLQNYYSADYIGVNAWKEIKMSDLPDKSSLWNLSHNGSLMEEAPVTSFGFDCSGIADITVGTLTAVFSSANPYILALADTDKTAFIVEAIKYIKEAEKSGYYEAEAPEFKAFCNAVEALKASNGKEEMLAVAELKAAWMLMDPETYPTGDTTDWSVADWVYAANKVDISGLSDTEDFTTALQNAIAIRDADNMALGCNLKEFSTAEDLGDTLSALGENHINKAEIKAYYFNGNEKNSVESENASSLYDNSFDTNFEIADLTFTEDGSYFELIFAFDGRVKISDLLVGNAATEALRNSEYRLYVADSVDKLFFSESIVAHSENAQNSQIQIFNYDGKPDISGSYFALRVYSPFADSNSYDNVLRLSEFGIYGEYQLYNVKFGSFTNEEMAEFGSSLLNLPETKGYVKSAKGVKSQWNNSETDGFTYPISNLTDVNNNTGIGLGTYAGTAIVEAGAEIDIHIFFDLREVYYIKKLFINHWNQPYLYTGKYNIKVSENYATLFKDESTVLEYNNMVDSENGTSLAQLFEAVGEGVKGRYVDFNITVPINDYKTSLEKYSGLAYIRLRDVAVYGEKYQKPLKEINFLSHMPVELYRTDENGNKTTIGENEYNGIDYQYAYDGNYDISTPIAQNGKTIDVLFNLCANKTVNAVKLRTLTENIKGLKVYAATSVEGVWSSDSLVVDYSGDAVNNISRTFCEEPIVARYVRFSITDTANGIFDPTEFEVIGWNSQEFYYYNVAEERGGFVDIWLEEKDTYNIRSTEDNANEYKTVSWLYGMPNAFDGEIASVADFFGGSLGDENGNGKESISLLVDLGALIALDNIEFVSGSTSDYWPSEINFYVGEDEILLFGKNAKPVAQFTEKCSDESGSYNHIMLPTVAQYVRIEIVNSTQKYYEFTNMVATVISEIRINGFNIMNNSSSEGVAASVTDEETGIRADVLALRENDVFTTVQGITVTKRPASKEEKRSMTEQGVAYASDIYDVYLLDANGNIVTDTGGRDINVYIPKALFAGAGEAYVIANIDGEYTMVEFEADGEYCIVKLSDAYNMSVAFCEFVDIPEETEDDDTPTNTDNSVEDEDDDTEADDEKAEDDDDTDNGNKKRKKVRVVRKGDGTDISDYLWIIIVVVAIVIVAAGITVFIILANKKKKEQEEEA